MRIDRRAAIVIALYALLAVTVIPVFPHYRSPNEFTRWATAAAIVEYRTLEVSRLAPLLGPNFEDLAEVNGRFYSNKAPGGMLVGLPAYALARVFIGPPSSENMRVALTAMRLVGATLPVLLLAVLFVLTARRLNGENESAAIAALLFGTPLCAYGMLYFSHALTASAIFIAWVLLFVIPTARRDIAAGALIGLAVMSEFPVAIAAVPLLACVADWRILARIVAGGVPFALMLALYNHTVFGSFLTTSYRFEREPSYRELARHGIFGIGLPDPAVLGQLLVGPIRGLFVFSPILLLGFLAIRTVRERLTPRQRWSLLLTPLALIIGFAGYPNWHGGWTTGARYLVPAMPFLAFLLVFIRWTWLASALLGASVVASALTSLVFPFVPQNVPAPWGTFALPLLLDGCIAPNVFHFAGQAAGIAMPLLIVIAAVMMSAPLRAVVVVGGALWLLIGMRAPVGPTVVMERAFIQEVPFEYDGALQRAAPPGVAIDPSILEQAREARRAPPTSWPFR